MRFWTSAFVSAYVCFLTTRTFKHLKKKKKKTFSPLREAIQRGKRACAQRAALAAQPYQQESQSIYSWRNMQEVQEKWLFVFQVIPRHKKTKHVINMSHKTTGTIIWCHWSAGPSWADGSFRNPTPVTGTILLQSNASFQLLLILYMSGMFNVCYLERLNISKSLYVWVFGLSALKRQRASGHQASRFIYTKCFIITPHKFRCPFECLTQLKEHSASL